ncbi:MAG: hypothetical protein R3E66_24010 [bacterium]
MTLWSKHRADEKRARFSRNCTPGRARQFFDDRVMKWFIPSKSASRGLFSRVFDPGSVVLNLLGRIFGEVFVKDLVDFFVLLSFLRNVANTRRR